jgi:hypothetical protein
MRRLKYGLFFCDIIHCHPCDTLPIRPVDDPIELARPIFYSWRRNRSGTHAPRFWLKTQTRRSLKALVSRETSARPDRAGEWRRAPMWPAPTRHPVTCALRWIYSTIRFIQQKGEVEPWATRGSPCPALRDNCTCGHGFGALPAHAYSAPAHAMGSIRTAGVQRLGNSTF